MSTKLTKKILEDFGFSQKEARIYGALLELGEASLTDIARKTKYPRSTCYSVLEKMTEKGAIFEYTRGKIKHFAPQNPKKLLIELQNRAEIIREAMPELANLYKGSATKPHIVYYVGRDEIEQMYNALLKERNLKKYDIIASEKDWLTMDKRFFERFKQKRAGSGITTRLMLEYSETAQDRKKQALQTLSEVKILPPAMSSPFSGGCYIFKKKVIFVAYRGEKMAIEIHSPEIASIMQMVFKFMWQMITL